MHNPSKGLGLHEQGILEPIQINANLGFQGLDYISHDKDVSHSSTKAKETSSKIKIRASCHSSHELSTTNPFINPFISITNTCIDLNHPSPKSPIGPTFTHIS